MAGILKAADSMRNRGSTNQPVSKTAQGEHKPTGRTDSEAFRIGDQSTVFREAHKIKMQSRF